MGSLRLQNVTKEYDDVIAVDDMNLDINDSEFICLVGPSGCGKSTTLEMIGGLTMPTEGKVFIDDNDVTNLPPKDRGLAMVFQNIALFPHMDVYDNISYGLRLRDISKEEIDQKVDEAAEILQLEGMLDRMPSELSGGQRQRVAIGRAIVRDPEVFLMDEPLANLDAKLRVHMRTELQRLQRQLDVTTIYVTHDQEEAMTMSDRIAIINQGVLQQIAPPLVCYNEPANLFVAGFIGSPSMNFLEGEINGDRLRFDSFNVDISSVEVPDDVDRLTLGIRLEDVYPVSESSAIVDPSQEVSTTVDVLEPVGEQIYVYLDTEESAADIPVDAQEDDDIAGSDESLLMSLDPDYQIEEGEKMDVVFDRSKIHLFETPSGEAIAHGLTTREVAGDHPQTD
ncbi:ABC transporter ATP-binding protein [Saliphagus infecundisoli]|uniref:ABC-type D-xylose/L-arabinose transporter n=1 Tax=Saliphagus infecundisoli TaxID=1849069 RepID=A0ABD5QJQ5_9EURY|nr:ABC transporter ATP-binding protein [Saliphagus infecundisoli]